MKLYHGTSIQNLPAIEREGVSQPSYWGTLVEATTFASHFGRDAVLLEAEIPNHALEASMLMAESLYENGDIDDMPSLDDLPFSLENLGGVMCNKDVQDFTIIKMTREVSSDFSGIEP